MRVVKARYCGACYGVQRALNIAKEALESGKSTCTLGPLIHNPGVVRHLEEHGVKAVADPSQIDTPAVIIRSHGIAPQLRRRLQESGFEVIDATCPHVLRAQNAAGKLAKQMPFVLVVGEAGHPEVESLEAFARENGAEVAVCSSAEQLPLEIPERVGVVVQTTQTRKVLDDILKALGDRGIEAKVCNTICQATQERQDSAVELATQVDAMVVIGGKNSANTAHLTEICARKCPNTWHIEDIAELMAIDFSQVETVGVTAGASTPQIQITRVCAYLEGLA